jgi:hypothetical protein
MKTVDESVYLVELPTQYGRLSHASIVAVLVWSTGITVCCFEFVGYLGDLVLQ